MPGGPLHGLLNGSDVHVPITFTYTNATAMNAASGFVTNDLHKFAVTTSDNLVWILTATTPTWQAVSTSGGGGASLPPDFISGMNLEWLSSNSLLVKSGSAYNQSLGGVATVTTDVTLTSLATVASTWYYIYMTTTGAIEVSTTAAAAPYFGYARSKTGDTSRRYVGSIRASSSGGNIYNFLRTSQGLTIYREDTATGALEFREVAAGTQSSAAWATVACGNVVPPTSRFAVARIGNNSDRILVTSTSDLSLTPGSNQGVNQVLPVATGAASGWNSLICTHPLDSTQNFQYHFSNVGPAYGGAYIDIIGYQDER